MREQIYERGSRYSLMKIGIIGSGNIGGTAGETPSQCWS